VTPNDAYAHNMLTSGTDGYDHFGFLSPGSVQNDEIMYGTAYNSSVPGILDEDTGTHPSPSRGGIVQNVVGDHQVGMSDTEVPAGMAEPDFPGANPDRFGKWSAASDLNQDMVNGAYWRELKQDGVLDRDVPTDEANAQKYAGSHDRHPVPDLALNSWHMGFGRSAKGSKQPWEVERERMYGDDWRSKVNTGTHEEVEKHLGTYGSKQGQAYFKSSPPMKEGQGSGQSLSDSIRF